MVSLLIYVTPWSTGEAVFFCKTDIIVVSSILGCYICFSVYVKKKKVKKIKCFNRGCPRRTTLDIFEVEEEKEV